MLRLDTRPRSVRVAGRDRGPNMLAFVVSLGLHGAALAGVVFSREATPPKPYTVIAVEFIQAANIMGSPAKDTGERPAVSQAKARLADSGVLDERPAAAEAPSGNPSLTAGNAVVPEAILRVPPPPRRKPLAPKPPARPKSSKTRFEEKLTDMKDESFRSANRMSAREAAPSDVDRAAAQTQPTASLNPAKNPVMAALPASTRGSGIAGTLGKNPGTRPQYASGGLSNAPPRYPFLARRRGHEGRVVLRVQVSAAGDATAVTIRRSSGYRLLDKAAVEAVETWRFFPSKRAGIPIAGSVDVPVSFKLTDR